MKRVSLRALLGMLVLVVVAIVLLRVLRPEEPPPAATAPGGDTSAGRSGTEPEAPAPETPAGDETAAPGAGMELDGTWDVVDLEEVRRALPENLYWEMSVPTDDQRVIDARAAERARWNHELGRILAGDAGEGEIHAYYAHRQRLSADYVEFTSYLLDHYGSRLPERDVGLLELARRLHLARLEEIPRKTQEALDRKREQDEARERWRREEEAFATETETAPEM